MINRWRRLCGPRKAQRGSTLLEVLIAGAVTTIGLIGMLGLMTTAIASDNRNRMDSQSTALAQLVLQEIKTQPPNSTNVITITDSAGIPHDICVSAGAAHDNCPAGGGSTNFSVDPIEGYSMVYALCKSLPCSADDVGKHSNFDVRWSVQVMTEQTTLVTVAVRPTSNSVSESNQSRDLKFFTLPVVIQGFAAKDPVDL